MIGKVKETNEVSLELHLPLVAILLMRFGWVHLLNIFELLLDTRPQLVESLLHALHVFRDIPLFVDSLASIRKLLNNRFNGVHKN